MISQRKVREKLLTLCHDLRQEVPLTANKHDMATIKAWFSGCRNGREKAIDQFEFFIKEFFPVDEFGDLLGNIQESGWPICPECGNDMEYDVGSPDG